MDIPRDVPSTALPPLSPFLLSLFLPSLFPASSNCPPLSSLPLSLCPFFLFSFFLSFYFFFFFCPFPSYPPRAVPTLSPSCFPVGLVAACFSFLAGPAVPDFLVWFLPPQSFSNHHHHHSLPLVLSLSCLQLLSRNGCVSLHLRLLLPLVGFVLELQKKSSTRPLLPPLSRWLCLPWTVSSSPTSPPHSNVLLLPLWKRGSFLFLVVVFFCILCIRIVLDTLVADSLRSAQARLA